MISKDDEYRKQAAEAQAMSDRSVSVVEQEAWRRIARGFTELIRRPAQHVQATQQQQQIQPKKDET
jgi:hypothetical protein